MRAKQAKPIAHCDSSAAMRSWRTGRRDANALQYPELGGLYSMLCLEIQDVYSPFFYLHDKKNMKMIIKLCLFQIRLGTQGTSRMKICYVIFTSNMIIDYNNSTKNAKDLGSLLQAIKCQKFP